MIIETSGWCHLKEENKLFLRCEFQRMYTSMLWLEKISMAKFGVYAF